MVLFPDTPRAEGSMRICRRLLGGSAVTGCLVLFLMLVINPGNARADWLQDFEAEAADWMIEAGIPGMSIAVVKNDAVIYARGFGHLSVDPNSPKVDANTIFEIGSCTKAFGATQLAILADQKQLAWTDQVHRHLPSFKMHDPWVNKNFQVEDLLCHRSGLPWYSLFGMMFLDYPMGAQVRGIRFEPPATSFRTSFAYQNIMYVAVSRLIEAKTGQSWGQNLSEKIFAPLGMSRSVTTTAELETLGNVAYGHLLLPDGSLSPVAPNWANSFVVDKSFAAGAIRSSALDMAQWIRLNLALGRWGDQQIVTESNMRYLQAPKVLQAPYANGPASPYWGAVSYASGWQYFGLSPQPLITHDGTEIGFKSSVLLVPGANLGVVILANIGANFTGNSSFNYRPGVVQKLAFRFYDHYFGRQSSQVGLDQAMSESQAPPQWEAEPNTPPAAEQALARPLGDYCGVYSHPAFGEFRVHQSGGGLEIVMGPHKIRAKMVPTGLDAFRAVLPNYPETFPAYYPFTFQFPDSGPATMTLGTLFGWPQNDVFSKVVQ